MSLTLRWRDEEAFRETAFRLFAWGALAGGLVFLASPPSSGRLASLVTGFPALFGLASLAVLWRRGQGIGFVTAAALALAGAIAQYGWARWYGESLAAAPIESAAAGAAVGLIVSLGFLPRSLIVVSRKVAQKGERAEAALRSRGQDEMAALVRQACAKWTRVSESFAEASASADDLPAMETLERAMLRFLAEATHYAQISPGAALPHADELRARELRVGALLERTRDAHAREQLLRAQVALAAQHRHLQEIETGRDRALAHMHRYVAAMERLHLALLCQRSSDASQREEVVQPIIDDLVCLADDIDARAGEMADLSDT